MKHITAKQFDSPPATQSWRGVCPGCGQHYELSQVDHAPMNGRGVRRAFCTDTDCKTTDGTRRSVGFLLYTPEVVEAKPSAKKKAAKK